MVGLFLCVTPTCPIHCVFLNWILGNPFLHGKGRDKKNTPGNLDDQHEDSANQVIDNNYMQTNPQKEDENNQ